MTKGEQRLMQVRESRHDGAAVSAAAHHQDADGALQELGIGRMCHSEAASSFLRYSFNGSISTSVHRGNRLFPARLLQRAAVPPFRLVSRPAPPGWVNSL